MKKIFRKKQKITNPFLEYDGKLIPSDKFHPVFVTGVGRSATHYLAVLFNQHSDFNSYHLDDIGNAVADSFLMYSTWYHLPVDLSGFFASRSYLISKSEKDNTTYIESNPYLALSVGDISKFYPNAKFVIVIRDPRKVVLSHLNKGWYENYSPVFDLKYKAPGYQYNVASPNHFFGRICPNGLKGFKEWNTLSQVGKIAWMWNTLNLNIEKSLRSIDKIRYKIIHIDDFDYKQYLSLLDFLNCKKPIGVTQFENLRNQGIKKTTTKKFDGWGEKEEDEFIEQIKAVKI